MALAPDLETWNDVVLTILSAFYAHIHAICCFFGLSRNAGLPHK